MERKTIFSPEQIIKPKQHLIQGELDVAHILEDIEMTNKIMNFLKRHRVPVKEMLYRGVDLSSDVLKLIEETGIDTEFGKIMADTYKEIYQEGAVSGDHAVDYAFRHPAPGLLVYKSSYFQETDYQTYILLPDVDPSQAISAILKLKAGYKLRNHVIINNLNYVYKRI